MNCLTRIRQRYPTTAASDKKLADYILSQPDETRHLSSQQLAAEAGVNQSSVVKFAQKHRIQRLSGAEARRLVKRWRNQPGSALRPGA